MGKTIEDKLMGILNDPMKFKIKKGMCAYEMVQDLLNNGKTYTIHTSGRGRNTQYRDYTNDLCTALNFAGVPYEEGNDAPRGGAYGKFIKIDCVSFWKRLIAKKGGKK